MTTDAGPEQVDDGAYAVDYPSGKRELHGTGAPAFEISIGDESQLRRIWTENIYSVALDFVRGRFDISGDLIAALRLRQAYAHSGFLDKVWSLAARLAPMRIETWLQRRERAAKNIRFHYDVSNDFYRNFLDARLVYSSALFENTSWSLEQAQEAKLRRICEDLHLQPGERFLDVGCGWGALLVYAADCYRVTATGCTLSHTQYEFTNSLICARDLEKHASVMELDYHDLSSHFQKIASIGMFEHVGRHRLLGYFRKIYDLLEHRGLFLNSGIVRPQTVSDDLQTWFLRKRVFPGGELAHLSDVIRAAERAGFAIVRIESLRRDYARTCEEWVHRLSRNKEICVGLVGDERYRTWLLYLAASALSFDAGTTDVFSILMSKK